MWFLHSAMNSMLTAAVVLVLCRCCSAQVGGCTPTGSNLITGDGKLSNNIPQSNISPGSGSEFYAQRDTVHEYCSIL